MLNIFEIYIDIQSLNQVYEIFVIINVKRLHVILSSWCLQYLNLNKDMLSLMAYWEEINF